MEHLACPTTVVQSRCGPNHSATEVNEEEANRAQNTLPPEINFVKADVRDIQAPRELCCFMDEENESHVITFEVHY